MIGLVGVCDNHASANPAYQKKEIKVPLKDKATLTHDLAAVRDEIALARLRMEALQAAYQEYNVLSTKLMRLRDRERDIDTQLAELDGRFIRVPLGASGRESKVKDRAAEAKRLYDSLDKDARRKLFNALKTLVEKK